MIIALDFDGTFDQDPVFWQEFLALCKKWHTVLIVSCRIDDEDGENRETIQAMTGVEFWRIKLTSGEAKRHYMERHGWKIDVWIDDEPKVVEQGR